MNEPREPKENVIQKHARQFGPAATGGVVGTVIGGPLGAAVGFGIGYAAQEVLARMLAPRQVHRVDVTLDATAQRIEERVTARDPLREDGFFDEQDEHRSDAQEVAEGILFTAMTDYEERKTRFYGYLLANIAFEPAVDRGTAHALLRLAEGLSYRQLCLLALVENKESFPLPAPRREYTEWRSWSVQHDLDEIGFARLELVGGPFPVGTPGNLDLQSQGKLLYELMELSKIPAADLQELADLLNESG
jgi:hypothetical protein